MAIIAPPPPQPQDVYSNHPRLPGARPSFVSPQVQALQAAISARAANGAGQGTGYGNTVPIAGGQLPQPGQLTPQQLALAQFHQQQQAQAAQAGMGAATQPGQLPPDQQAAVNGLAGMMPQSGDPNIMGGVGQNPDGTFPTPVVSQQAINTGLANRIAQIPSPQATGVPQTAPVNAGPQGYSNFGGQPMGGVAGLMNLYRTR